MSEGRRGKEKSVSVSLKGDLKTVVNWDQDLVFKWFNFNTSDDVLMKITCMPFTWRLENIILKTHSR